MLDELDPNAADYLHANNARSRIAFATVALRNMERLTRIDSGPFFWVTLIPKQFVVPLDVAGEFDFRRIQAWTHQVLRGLSYVGMVEAALYTNVKALSIKHQCVISWHVHLIVWGATEAAVQEIMAEINRRYDALLPGVAPAYAVEVTPAEVLEKTLYMLKSPQSNYRVWAKSRHRVDPATGEIVRRPTGRFQQKKGELRPGEMVRMCKVLAGKHLHQLAFAGGDGKAVLTEIRRDALRPLRREQARLAVNEAIRNRLRQGPFRPGS